MYSIPLLPFPESLGSHRLQVKELSRLDLRYRDPRYLDPLHPQHACMLGLERSLPACLLYILERHFTLLLINQNIIQYSYQTKDFFSLKKIHPIREDTHKKKVFLVVGPLRFYPPYTNGLVVHATIFF